MAVLGRALPLAICLLAFTPREASAFEPGADLELGVGVSLFGMGAGIGVGLSPVEWFRWVSRFTVNALAVEQGSGDGDRNDMAGYASLSSGLELGFFENTFALYAGAEAAVLFLGDAHFIVPARNVVSGYGAGPVFGVHVPLPFADGFGLALDVPLIYTVPLSVEGNLEGAIARGPHLIPAPRLFARQRF
jgi:hypothetical protein